MTDMIIKKSKLKQLIIREIKSVIKEYNYGSGSGSTGTISFPSKSQRALWDTELTGQISDGMWENSKPNNHFEFWNDLISKDGPGEVVTNQQYRIQKNNYNFLALVPIIGNRMVKIGRMGKITLDDKMLNSAGYMPETYEEFKKTKFPSYAKKPDDITAKKYYEVKYTENDLKNDLRKIKDIIKNVKSQ